VLHPVGPLPARVYWRRRVLALGLLVSVLGGGGWTGWAAWTGRLPLPLSTASAQGPVAAPALTGVLPSMAGVRLPADPPPAAGGTPAAPSPAAPVPPAAPAPSAVTGPPCTDDMVGLTLTAPPSATAGGATQLTLTVIDTSVLPCARDVGTAEQEVVLLDAAGDRLWSSADCTPAARAPRLFAPGDRVDLPIAWDGRASAPGCTGARAAVPAGSYLLRARLGTRTAADVPLTVG
jgi:hypothetical protein